MIKTRKILKKYCRIDGPFRIFDSVCKIFYFLDFEGSIVFIDALTRAFQHKRFVVGLKVDPNSKKYFQDLSGYWNIVIDTKNIEELCTLFNINMIIYRSYMNISDYKNKPYSLF
jgi:hypothetical protein